MESRNRRRPDHAQLRSMWESGKRQTVFYCSTCDLYGYAAKGGEDRHNSSNKHVQLVAQRAFQASKPVDTVKNSVTDTGYGTLSDEGEEVPSKFKRPRYIYEQDIGVDDGFGIADPYEEPASPIQFPAEESQDGVTIIYGPPTADMDRTQLYIQRHPHAKDKPVHPRSVIPPTSNSLYWPFNSEADFKQVEVFYDSNLSNTAMDSQLRLNRENKQSLCTLKNAKEVHNTFSRAFSLPDEKFVGQTVTTIFNGKEYYHDLYYRDFLHAIRDIVADPTFNEVLALDPEKLWIASPDGDGFTRLYKQYHHADNMWDMQDRLGPNSSPLVLSIYSDGTQLGGFGNKSIWPIYFWIANLPHEMRGSLGKGGATLLGYLPHPADFDDIPEAILANFRAQVFHDCCRIIVASIVDVARDGSMFRLGTGAFRHLTVILGILPNDYQEICRVYRLIGPKAKLIPGACPQDLVPNDQLDNNDATWPKRNSPYEEWAVKIALGLGPDDAEVPNIHSCGIRPVTSAFDNLTNIYFEFCLTVAADGLHMFKQGKYGKQWLVKLFHWMLNSQKEELDAMFRDLPRYPGLKHYAQGICNLKWRSGADHAVIAKLLVPVLDMVLPGKGMKPKHFPYNLTLRSNIIRLFRVMGEFMVLMQFTTHTGSTLEMMENVLGRMSGLEKAVAASLNTIEEGLTTKKDLKINLNTFKNHFIYHHFTESIRSKGPICNTDTGYVLSKAGFYGT